MKGKTLIPVRAFQRTIAILECIFDPDLKPLKHVSLYDVQCKLNSAGAVGRVSILVSDFTILDLVIDLIVMEPSNEVFQKACHLAKALLIDGNDEVQTSVYKRLNEKKVAGKFFRAFILKLQAAQNRIKSDMMSGSNTKKLNRRFFQRDQRWKFFSLYTKACNEILNLAFSSTSISRRCRFLDSVLVHTRKIFLAKISKIPYMHFLQASFLCQYIRWVMNRIIPCIAWNHPESSLCCH